MAATRAEILVSMLDYLNDLDDHFGALVKSNRARIAETNARIAQTRADIASGEE